MGRRPAILLVEDEESITVPLAAALGREGFETDVAGTVADALKQAEASCPDLVLLDVGLPDGSGFDVCRELRRRSDVPILMLTARGDTTDRVVGLEIGADDYIVKPFAAREVVARVRAVLRRVEQRTPPNAELVSIGELTLDSSRRTASLNGDSLTLSRKEFELLAVLMREAGSVVSREQLMSEVWDTTWMGSTKTLDVHISAVRKKLGDDPATPRFLHTARGVGFRFATADDLELESADAEEGPP
ncbi:MAG: response regulator transcription factor [Gaiellaceae bacterium]